ncbi:MAG: molybdenum cofactor biosynthesis protein MoaE [Desulfobacterales bacterium]|nr:molybdenum cofactor biosynthesis protein MoaE [Desulfobacterales bacterium]MBS3755376.1 molybdenum cofactor biosynthesis protein MoaE [Desulfobacterales bacterium]
MDQNRLIEKIKAHPEYHRVGMMLTHHGVVRGTSRDGRPVSGVRLQVKDEQVAGIIASEKQSPGIVEILVEFTDKAELAVGEDIMLIAVAGDFRENVLSCMSRMIDAVKQLVTAKTENFA